MRVRVYRRLIIVAYLNITRVNGGGGGVSRRPRRAPRIEMDHRAAADFNNWIRCWSGPTRRGTGRSRGNIDRDDDNYYCNIVYLSRSHCCTCIAAAVIGLKRIENNHRCII